MKKLIRSLSRIVVPAALLAVSVVMPGLAPTAMAAQGSGTNVTPMPRDDYYGMIGGDDDDCSFVNPCLIAMEGGDWVVDTGAPDIVHLMRREEE